MSVLDRHQLSEVLLDQGPVDRLLFGRVVDYLGLLVHLLDVDLGRLVRLLYAGHWHHRLRPLFVLDP